MGIAHMVGFVVLAATAAMAQRPVTACGSLDKPRTAYILQQDVTSDGTCFLVVAEGVTLDLNQHTITYGAASKWKPGDETGVHVHGVLGQACWDVGGRADPKSCGEGFTLLTVKNGRIVQAPNAPPNSHAIRLGQGAMRNFTLEDVTISIASPSTSAVMIVGGRGGNRIRRVKVENQSTYVFNRHQIEGAAIRIIDIAKDAQPDVIEDVQVKGGPQTGVVETSPGARVVGNRIALAGAFTNDFGIFLFGERSVAANNLIEGRSRGIQADTRAAVIENNTIRTYEEPVNEEYGGCQAGGTYGIQLEARAQQARVQNNDVTVRATVCDARAFRVTDAKRNNQNTSLQNMYRAVKQPGPPGKAIAASFSGAREAAMENDTLEADTWNAEIGWDGAQNVVLRNVTFIKGANAGKDYATFALLPGSNNATYRPTSAEMRVIDAVFRNGASAESFFMHPLNYEKYATAAEYWIQWTFRLTVTDANGAPLPAVAVRVVDHKGVEAVNAKTGADGTLAPAVLTEFRRYNTLAAVEKEVFSYEAILTLGERTKRFPLKLTGPTQRTEILP